MQTAKSVGVYLLLSIVCIVAAFWEYSDLTQFEKDGGTRRMNSILLMAYNVGGKNGVFGLLMVVGVGFLAGAVVTLVKAMRKE